MDTASASGRRLATSALEFEHREWKEQRWALLRRFVRDRTVVVGTLIVVIFGLIAIFAPVVAPHDPTAVDARSILAESSRDHLLGTDNL
ncbi:MAG: hypothetical protein ACRD1H_19170, partial [Vicinamibacterales bacterium]